MSARILPVMVAPVRLPHARPDAHRPTRLRVGLLGFGRAGQAVAQVLRAEPDIELCWVARRQLPQGDASAAHTLPGSAIPIVSTAETPLCELIEQRPVDALVDFSSAETASRYLPAMHRHGLMLVSAVSSYLPAQVDDIRALSDRCRILCSPNITVGINFLIVAARLLQTIAPQADVEIIEQHFRDKPEVSGTARRMAHTLDLDEARITSLRLGGIVGHHEVVFGFPHQTVRLTHDSIRREAFGTGAAFALRELRKLPPGFHTMEDLIARVMRSQLLAA